LNIIFWRLLPFKNQTGALWRRLRGEEGEAVRHEMREAMMSLGQLYESERRYLLEATAKAAGYSGDDVQAFTEHIQTIFEQTSMMPGGFGFRGGRVGPQAAEAPGSL